MTTARFARLASPTARAMSQAYLLAAASKHPTVHARFTCPACGGTIEFSGRADEPHRTAGSCKTAGCVRWAAQ